MSNNSKSLGFKVERANASRRKSEMVTDKKIRAKSEYFAARGFREGEHRNISMAQR